MRILLVEDSRATRMIVRSTVESLGLDGLEILEAADGEEALGLLRDGPDVDLVLADWDMPKMDGLTFLKTLKASPERADVPVIMVTSQSTRDKVTEALRCGARDYVVKPFNAAVLLQKLQPFLGRPEAAPLNDTSIMLREIVTAARAEKEKPFFHRLPAEIGQALTRRGAEKTFPPGGVVVTAGKTLDTLLLLINGELRATPDVGAPPLRSGDAVEPRAFLSNEPASRTWTAAGEATLLVVDRMVLADALRKHPKLSQHLRELTNGPVAAEPPAPGLTGALSDFPLEDLLQVLSVTRKTGVLRLTKRERGAGIFFEYGEIKHAWTDTLRGEEAFYQLLDWRDALFVFESGRREDATTLRTPLMTLLMEGARRKDETKSLRRD